MKILILIFTLLSQISSAKTLTCTSEKNGVVTFMADMSGSCDGGYFFSINGLGFGLKSNIQAEFKIHCPFSDEPLGAFVGVHSSLLGVEGGAFLNYEKGLCFLSGVGLKFIGNIHGAALIIQNIHDNHKYYEALER